MSWNYSFEYDQNFRKALRTTPGVAYYLHKSCEDWLTTNLHRGKDYEYSVVVEYMTLVAEYIYFNEEQDLLAFRLACGI